MSTIPQNNEVLKHVAADELFVLAGVYGVLLLAGYRTCGLSGYTKVPTRWWSGSGRWSLNTLWRAYRAVLWLSHTTLIGCSLRKWTEAKILETDQLIAQQPHLIWIAARITQLLAAAHPNPR